MMLYNDKPWQSLSQNTKDSDDHDYMTMIAIEIYINYGPNN